MITDSYEPDGEFCFYPILPGTFLNIIVEKLGYDNGQKNGYINDDATWVIPMNPQVSTYLLFIEYLIEIIVHMFYTHF